MALPEPSRHQSLGSRESHAVAIPLSPDVINDDPSLRYYRAPRTTGVRETGNGVAKIAY